MGIKGFPGVDPQTTGQHQPTAQQAKGDPWPWPQSEDKFAKPAPQFAGEASEAFMRSIG